MKINKRCQDNILSMKVSPGAFLELFESIAADIEIRESPAGTLVVLCYKEGDLEVGDFAPELHFVVRRVAEQPADAEQENG